LDHVIDDIFVIDGVAHPFNSSPENIEARSLQSANPIIYVKDEKYALTREEKLTDFSSYATAHALFAESQADLAVLQALPRFSFTRGPFCSVEKVIAMRDRWPDRFIVYGTVDTMDVDEAIKSLEFQVRELKIDGLKMYPAIRWGGKMNGWKMDDPNYALPIIDAARDLGLKNVSVHKVIPVGMDVEFFRIPDIEVALQTFPDINFHVVHAGFGFLEEFRMLLELYPNLYANLENTAGFAVARPRLFAEILGEMLYWGRAEQINFASGVNLMHPRPPLEAMYEFEMPEDLIEGYGYPEVTHEMKRLMLGGNIARVHGIDINAARNKFADDEFEVAKRDGLCEPWSGLRERKGEAVPA
jgi:predicted TIM-barrel fold metal-dependent hydrolase